MSSHFYEHLPLKKALAPGALPAPAAPGAPRSRTTWPRPKPGRPNPPGEGRD